MDDCMSDWLNDWISSWVVEPPIPQAGTMPPATSRCSPKWQELYHMTASFVRAAVPMFCQLSRIAGAVWSLQLPESYCDVLFPSISTSQLLLLSWSTWWRESWPWTFHINDINDTTDINDMNDIDIMFIHVPYKLPNHVMFVTLW